MEGTMKQAWLMGKGGPFEVRDVPIPKAGPEELLVRVKASSLCNQTDLNSIRALHPPHDHQMLGMLPHDMRVWAGRAPDALSKYYPSKRYPIAPYPTMMGHEGIGEIAEIGPYSALTDNETDEVRLEIGTRVVGIPIVGGLGEYIIAGRRRWLPVPDSIDDVSGTMIEPAFMVLNAVRQTVTIGDVVCVVGQGVLGLLATQIAKAMGARKVIAVEPLAHKRALALKLGADVVIDPDACGGKITDAVLEAGGGGVDSALECAGVPESIAYLPYIMKNGGIIGQIGACCDPVLIDWCYIHFRGLKVVGGSHLLQTGHFPRLMRRAIDIIASGQIDVKSMITHRYHELTAANLYEAFNLIEKDIPVKAVFIFGES